MYLTITAHGFEYIERDIMASAGRAHFIEPALEVIAEDMIEGTKTEFSSQGRRFGGSWKDITERWREEKVERGEDPRILFQTHRLIESLTDRDNDEMIMEINHRGIEYGSAVPYADAHQHGTGRLPARPFISFQGGDLTRWSKIIAAYIVDPMKRGGKAERG